MTSVYTDVKTTAMASGVVVDFNATTSIPEVSAADHILKGFENENLRQVVSNLRDTALERFDSPNPVEVRLRALEELLGLYESGEVLEIRDISDEDAETEVIELFESSDKHLFYSDIEERLCLDIDQVVRVCTKLMSDRKIVIDEAH